MDQLRIPSICCVLLVLCSAKMASANPERPNIVFIMSDDMGWNDVSHHGSDQILTPNIDVLAYSGVALHRYYSYPLCTPARSALLTGKYAHRIGMQGYPLTNSEDRGIPLTEKLLPAYLKDLGYDTHLVGKWHVGASRPSYLPTNRGFDSHFGFRGGDVDYYEYDSEENWKSRSVAGFGLYRNLTPAWDVDGYVTDIFTKEAVKIINGHSKSNPLYLHLAYSAPHAAQAGAPLQAPPSSVRANRHVLLPARRLVAGMVSTLDEGIGEVVKALAENEMLNNTIIVFVGDNGGMTEGLSQNWASNYPLRGGKFSPFEAGVRVVGLIWSTMIPRSDIWSGMMHVTDWLPTLLTAIGGKAPENLDGIDQWKSILDLKESKRNKTILDVNDYNNVNDVNDVYSTMISGDYKIVAGSPSEEFGRYLSENLLELTGEIPSYTEHIKSSHVYDVMLKLGKTLNMDVVVDRSNRMKINCTKSEEAICIPTEDKPCLYNIILDPCEYHDLAASLPELTVELTKQLQAEWNKRVPRVVPLFRDPASDPKLHNNTWAPWMDA